MIKQGNVYTKRSRTYLMGVAIILVVMTHVVTQEVSHPIHTLFSLFFKEGHCGVNIFFILSTYGLCFSYNHHSLTDFYKKRIMRIWPMYPAACIARHLIRWDGDFLNFIASSISDITGIFLFQRTTDFFWYMGVLTILYLLFPLIYKLCDLTSKYKMHVLLLTCALVWIGTSSDYGNNQIYLHTLTRIPCMYLGFFTFLCEKEKNYDMAYLGYGFCALLSLTPIFPMAFLFLPAAIFLIARSSILPFERVVSFLGRHSLEIYLGHTFAVYHILSFPFSYPINLMLFFTLSATYSTLLYLIQNIFTKRIYPNLNLRILCQKLKNLSD